MYDIYFYYIKNIQDSLIKKTYFNNFVSDNQKSLLLKQFSNYFNLVASCSSSNLSQEEQNKLKILSLFRNSLDENPNIENIDLQFENLEDDLEVDELLNVVEIYLTLCKDFQYDSKSQFTEKILLNVLNKMKESCIQTHPDENVQLLFQLKSLEKKLNYNLEEVSLEVFKLLSSVLFEFEKNIIVYFDLLSHYNALFYISKKYDYLIRDKFYYKIYEIVKNNMDFKSNSNKIISLLFAMYERKVLDSSMLFTFSEILMSSETLQNLSDSNKIKLFCLDAQYSFLEKEVFEELYSTHSEIFKNNKNLKLLVKLYLILKQNVLDNHHIILEKNLKKYFNNLYSQLNESIIDEQIQISESILGKYTSQDDLVEILEDLINILDSKKSDKEIFVERYRIIINLVNTFFKINGISSTYHKEYIYHLCLQLGEEFHHYVFQNEKKD